MRSTHISIYSNPSPKIAYDSHTTKHTQNINTTLRMITTNTTNFFHWISVSKLRAKTRIDWKNWILAISNNQGGNNKGANNKNCKTDDNDMLICQTFCT